MTKRQKVYHSPASFHKDDNHARLGMSRLNARFGSTDGEDAGRSGQASAR
jgi:hypothetical protein